jgi:type IV pilus assembly protein PilZ
MTKSDRGEIVATIMSTKERPKAGQQAAASSERRGAPRIFVDLEVDYGNEDNFLFASIRDISATGIFVRTNTPESEGTHLNLRFTPRGSDNPFELEGKVIWTNPYRPGHCNSLNPGMGIRFIGLTQQQRERLVTFVRTLAYLDDADA